MQSAPEVTREKNKIIDYNDSMYDKLYSFISSLLFSKTELYVEILFYYGNISLKIDNNREIQDCIWHCKKCSEEIFVNKFNGNCGLRNILFMHLEIYKLYTKGSKYERMNIFDYERVIWSNIMEYYGVANIEIEKFRIGVVKNRHDSREYHESAIKLLDDHMLRLYHCKVCGMVVEHSDQRSMLVITKHIIAHIAEIKPLKSLRCRGCE